MELVDKPIVWSPQQEAIFHWGRTETGSVVVIARAGTGKTTSLVELVRWLRGQTAAMAFNKSAGEDLKKKFSKAGFDFKKAQAGTVHSFAFSALKKAYPELNRRDAVSAYKVEDLIDASGDEYALAYKKMVIKAVSLAKQRALGILRPIESKEAWLELITHFDVLSDLDDDEDKKFNLDLFVEACQRILKANNKKLDVVDFDDMCYLPILLKCRFWQFDNVIMDEAQDANPIRECVAAAMLRKGGRFIAVGDDMQAIYGFTGASNDALEILKKNFNAVTLPLTVTYRCPKSVVAYAKQWCSDYQAHESAPEGQVLTMPEGDLLARKDLLVAGNAILCRVTKPLVSLAFRLIRARIPCNIEGRDIAAGLIKLATKWKKVKTLDELETKIEEHFARQKTRFLAQRNEPALAALEDQTEALRAIIDQCVSEDKELVTDVVDYINRLFQDGVENVLVLSTIHKAKGREWEVVLWYDKANTCPSKWARQAWQREQEDHLCYVASTRAKSVLIDVLATAEEKGAKSPPAPAEQKAA